MYENAQLLFVSHQLFGNYFGTTDHSYIVTMIVSQFLFHINHARVPKQLFVI